MTHFEIKNALDNMVILVDTRERETASLRQRMREMRCRYERRKLDFGDYSAKCPLPNGEWLSLENAVSVERKMDFGELCNCYCNGRDRFRREFERARDANAKVYLLVEGASWEKAYLGRYRSFMQPQALVGSITAWLARYNCSLLFCEPQTSGKLIREVLYRELKERLEGEMDGTA